MPYLEQHHFILHEIYRNNKTEKNKKELEKIIYSTDNILLLCPRCHRMIHQGKIEKVKHMIDIVKKKRPVIFDNIKRAEELIGKDNIIDDMYNLK